jgi:hypothetical protein
MAATVTNQRHVVEVILERTPASLFVDRLWMISKISTEIIRFTRDAPKAAIRMHHNAPH